MSWGPLSSRARRVLMGAHDRGVDVVALAVALPRRCLEQACENA